MSKLSLETIMQETIWVGKFYYGGRISGTKRDIGHIDDSEFRDLDIACTENQPEFLQEFYRGYFSQREYYYIPDYYNKVYAREYYEKVYEDRMTEISSHYSDCSCAMEFDETANAEEVVGYYLVNYGSESLSMWTTNTEGKDLTEQDEEVTRLLKELFEEVR